MKYAIFTKVGDGSTEIDVEYQRTFETMKEVEEWIEKDMDDIPLEAYYIMKLHKVATARPRYRKPSEVF